LSVGGNEEQLGFCYISGCAVRFLLGL